MRHSSKVIASLCLAGLMTLPALGVGRIFIVPCGTSPGSAPFPANFAYTATNYPAQYSLSICAYADVTPDEELKGTQVTLPCSVPCSGGGSVDFVTVYGACAGGANIGLPCTKATEAVDCPGSTCGANGTAIYDAADPDALSQGYAGANFPATDQGDCEDFIPPAGINGNPRVAIALAGPPLGPAIPILTRIAYIGEFQYSISNSCVGTATIVVPNEPDSGMRNEANMPIVFTTAGMDITVPIGQCCNGTSCVGELTKKACELGGNTWTAGKTCLDPCQCTSNADCNDGNACTNNVCVLATGQCTFPNNFTAAQCCDPADGTVATISDSNTCTDDSCDSLTGIVTHTNVADGTSCSFDLLACTDDECIAGACVGTPIPDCIETPGLFFDFPVKEGVCSGGSLEGSQCLSDANCGTNVCVGGAAPGSTCTNDASCGVGGACSLALCGNLGHVCYAEDQAFVIEVVYGGGAGNAVGGQFAIDYDPACLEYVDATPGKVCDPSSPFTDWVFPPQVNEVNGSIFAAVGIGLGNPPAQQGVCVNGSNDGTVCSSNAQCTGGGTCDIGGTAVMMCLSFKKKGDCTSCDVCFTDVNPFHTYLSGNGGVLLNPVYPGSDGTLGTADDGVCSKQIYDAGVVTVVGPDFENGGPADCDTPTKTVTWATSAGATNSCEEDPIDLTCTVMHDSLPALATPVDCDSLPPSLPFDCEHGGIFPQGRATFHCEGSDRCGEHVVKDWTVFVSDQNSLDIVVQLQPLIEGNPIDRCIEFGFYANCVEDPIISKHTLTFGSPWNFIGHASGEILVPKGQYACITARDQSHTLRSTADIICNPDGTLSAVFKGDPFFNGGNWLIGGNLDGSHVIDILDFGVLVSQYLKPADANTTCADLGVCVDALGAVGSPEVSCDFDTAGGLDACPNGYTCVKRSNYRNADINGDGIVDNQDYTFIANNFLSEDKDSCCPGDGGGAGNAAGITSITVQELRAMGLGDLAIADVNHDGVLDTTDMEAFQQGVIPAPAHNNQPKKTSRR